MPTKDGPLPNILKEYNIEEFYKLFKEYKAIELE